MWRGLFLRTSYSPEIYRDDLRDRNILKESGGGDPTFIAMKDRLKKTEVESAVSKGLEERYGEPSDQRPTSLMPLGPDHRPRS